MSFEHYIQAGGRRLRCGFTTGTCAALAASAAAQCLLTGAWPQTVSLRTPKGLVVDAEPENCRLEDGGRYACCGVRKDAGDDADCTDGALIEAKVGLTDTPGIIIDGGIGVGRVTKPGLDQPPGEAAINHVPRRMIAEALADVAEAVDYEGGFAVTISVADGEERAKHTFNPDLGIEGGISILGTSGIVEPMSMQALIDTIALEIRQAAACGKRHLILVPGNYGLDYIAAQGLDRYGAAVVRCSNFIGDALDAAVAAGFESILVVGHISKLIKLAGGIMNTHSRIADCRCELLCAHAAACGATPATCRALLDVPTVDAGIAVLDEVGLREPVMASLLVAIQKHLDRRIAHATEAEESAAVRPQAGAILFSNTYGELGRTGGAENVLAIWDETATRDDNDGSEG